MDNIKYNIVTLKNGNSYFVLEEVSDNVDTYNLILNVEDDNDVKNRCELVDDPSRQKDEGDIRDSHQGSFQHTVFPAVQQIFSPCYHFAEPYHRMGKTGRITQ